LIRVLLVASSPALRAGLRSLLSTDAEIRIIGEESGRGATGNGYGEADVVITTSASVVPDEGEAPFSAPILFLQDDPLSLQWMMHSSSVWGVLPLETSAGELSAAVHALSEGLIVGARPLLFRSEDETPGQGPLTDREAEVLGWLAKGMANKQIALALGISEHTVKFHISSIYTKLNATNRTQAVREGLRNGWILL
jgi:DNA-binding NarL/FixJ family response regulator